MGWFRSFMTYATKNWGVAVEGLSVAEEVTAAGLAASETVDLINNVTDNVSSIKDQIQLLKNGPEVNADEKGSALVQTLANSTRVKEVKQVQSDANSIKSKKEAVMPDNSSNYDQDFLEDITEKFVNMTGLFADSDTFKELELKQLYRLESLIRDGDQEGVAKFLQDHPHLAEKVNEFQRLNPNFVGGEAVTGMLMNEMKENKFTKEDNIFSEQDSIRAGVILKRLRLNFSDDAICLMELYLSLKDGLQEAAWRRLGAVRERKAAEQRVMKLAEEILSGEETL